MKKTLFAIAIFILAFAGCNNGNNGADLDPISSTPFVDQSAPFSQNLKSAKDLLASTPTGAKVIADLNKLSSNGNVTAINPLTGSTPSGHVGVIREISSGVYEIDLLPTLSTADMAHGLAHEWVHVKNEIAEDAFVAQNKDLNDRMGVVAKAAQSHGLSSLDPSRKADEDLFFASVMFEEIQAYGLNLQIEKEGIPFNNSDLHSQGLFNFIKAAYVPAEVAPDFAVNGDEFVQLMGRFGNVVDFEKDFMAKTTSPPAGNNR